MGTTVGARSWSLKLSRVQCLSLVEFVADEAASDHDESDDDRVEQNAEHTDFELLAVTCFTRVLPNDFLDEVHHVLVAITDCHMKEVDEGEQYRKCFKQHGCGGSLSIRRHSPEEHGSSDYAVAPEEDGTPAGHDVDLVEDKLAGKAWKE